MWKLLRNLVIVAVLCVAVLKLVLWYEIQQGASRLVSRLAPYAQVQYGSVSSSLDGGVDFTGVTATVGKGTARETWRASQVTLATPGALWLVRRLLFGDETLPEHLGITLKGLQAPAAALGVGAESFWLSPLSLVPFETLGCGVVSRFSVADYQRMGLNPGLQQQHVEYHYDNASSTLTFVAELASPPFSTINLRGELQKFDPRTVAVGGWQKLHTSELAIGYVDGGYLAKRNRFCAQQAGITPAQFVDQHMAAVASFLAGRGVQPGQQVEAIYRSLVVEGGRVSVLSLPPAGSSVSQLLGETADVMTRQLNLTARRNDAPPVMVRLSFRPANDGQGPAPGPAETVATTIEPATAATTAVPAAAAPRAPAAAPPPVTVKPAPPLPTAVTAAKPSMPALTSTPAPTAPVAKVSPAVPASPIPGTSPKPAGPDPNAPLASTPPPPEGSTLALVWKPEVDRLQAVAPAPRDYDVIEYSALSTYSGRFVRLLTTTGKKVEGRIIGVDSNAVGLRIQKAGGTAELQIPRSVIFEIRVPRQRAADADG